MTMDARYPMDTLFLVFEEDYRFWPEGTDPDKADDYKTRLSDQVAKKKRSVSPNKIKRKMETQPSDSSGAYRPEHESGAYRPEGKGKEKGKRLATEFHETLPRGRTDASTDQGYSQNVADLIRMCTMCHRVGKGDIIWFGWNAAKTDKPSWVYNGSHGLAITKKGAQSIANAMVHRKVERGHIDLRLLDWLRAEGEATAAKACYLYPAVGSYYAHPSGCDPKNFGEDQGGRPSGWELKKAAQGTRVASDENKRQKWMIQWLGAPIKTARSWEAFEDDNTLHSEQFLWKSFKGEPTAPCTTLALTDKPSSSGDAAASLPPQEEEQGKSPPKEASGSTGNGRCARNSGRGWTRAKRRANYLALFHPFKFPSHCNPLYSTPSPSLPTLSDATPTPSHQCMDRQPTHGLVGRLVG